MHSSATRVLTALIAGGVLVGGSGVAYADTIADVIENGNASASIAAGATGTATVRINANSSDGIHGCNIATGESLTLGFSYSGSGVTAPNVVATECAKDYTVQINTTSAATNGTLTARIAQNLTNDPDASFRNQFGVDVTITAPADSTAPTSSATATAGGASYTSGAWTKETVAVSLAGADNTGGSGLKEIRYTTDGTAPTATSGTKYTTPLPYATDGTTTIKYAAVDNAGNVGTVNTFVVKVDKTAPVVTPGDVNDTTWRSSSLTQAFTATDNGGSGLADAADASFSLTATAALPTASKTVVDAAGNSTTRSVSALVDGTAPTSSARATAAVSATESVEYASGDWTNKTVTVALAGADNEGGSGVAGVHYTTDGNAPTANSAKYTTPLSYAADGTTTIKYVAVDSAGNVGTVNTFVVKVDKTAPTISGANVNDTDWRNTPLAATFTASDAGGSGLATASDASFELAASAESASATSPTVASKTVADQAGNTATRSVSALIDTTAPSISGANVNDTTWRNTPLTGSFTATDALSGLATTSRSSFSLSASQESANATTPTIASETVTDKAGNTATRRISALIDTTAPDISGADVVDTAWRNTPLSGSFTASDALSGLRTQADEAFTLTAANESANATTPTTHSKTVTDLAGNTATRLVSAKIDKTAPVIVGDDVIDTAWRAGSLSQSFTASDALSGLATASDSSFSLTAADESANATTPTTDSKTVTDAAGNPAVRTLSAKIDKSAPVILGGDVNDTTWRNTPLSGSFTASDRLSGLATASDSTFSLTASAQSRDANTPTTVSKTVTDAVGHSTTRTLSAKIDVTAPQISGDDVADTTWRNTPLTHSFTASDALSGLKTSTDGSFSVSAAAQSANATSPTVASKTVLDAAGNSSTRTVSALIDTTNPTITCGSTVPTYQLNQTNPAAVTGTVTDALSGPVSANASAAPDVSSVGTKTVAVSGRDVAGNTGSANCAYKVVYNWTGFFQPIDNVDAAGNYILNVAKAGSAIPVKFKLGGDQGMSVLDGTPAVGALTCGVNSEDVVEETSTATTSGLKYDALAGQYIYTWKTTSTMAGTCKQLIVKLADGTTHRANFKLTK